MIHLFEIGGLRVLLDVESGSVHLVDELARDLVKAMEAGDPDPVSALASRYPRPELHEALIEIESLKAGGLLFRPPPGRVVTWPGRGLRAICLNVSHSCNLTCGYCFASNGSFGGAPSLMSHEVARKAVDLLFSGDSEGCEIDFFGGEPLLNFEVLVGAARYARERARAEGRRLKLTLTTNATMLSGRNASVVNELMDNVVLSLDGRPGVHDAFRRYASGEGSYASVVPRVLGFLEARGDRDYWVRGTFTRRNLDFAKDVLHLVELGIKNISIEPVVGRDQPYSITENELPFVEMEYLELAGRWLELWREGRDFRFFHFETGLEGGACLNKRAYGCGAGIEYVAVTPEGAVYPCHQFVGREGHLLGDVYRGITNASLLESLAGANIFEKPGCRDCWARYYCGGGCHANAHLMSGDIRRPNPVECAMIKRRTECAIFVRVHRKMGHSLCNQQPKATIL